VPARFASSPDFWRRLVAAGGAALVLALVILTGSPELHHELHEGTSATAAEGCAIDLFASGVSLPLGAIVALRPALAWHDAAPVVVKVIRLRSPRYLHQPERGPPALD
jgi:hypothetical protein